MRKTRRKKNKTPYKMIIFGVITIALVFFIDSQTRPVINNMCSYYINQFATTKINEAIYESINEVNANYDDYVTLQTDSNGKIIAIHTKARQVTNIHTSIINKVDNALAHFPSENITVPIGSLSGIIWLSGLGPNISIKMQPKSKVNSEIISSLEEAGINQTLHKIRIEVTADITGFIPGYSNITQSKCDCLLAESLIVGSVPNYYTKVISNGQNSDSMSNIYRYDNQKNISKSDINGS
ncbi:MAG: sporulation protein YunB [Oscillospiraceae bacterium]|nr:sporulation protein YunB [Oscillospiraceae bacterium]